MDEPLDDFLVQLLETFLDLGDIDVLSPRLLSLSGGLLVGRRGIRRRPCEGFYDWHVDLLSFEDAAELQCVVVFWVVWRLALVKDSVPPNFGGDLQSLGQTFTKFRYGRDDKAEKVLIGEMVPGFHWHLPAPAKSIPTQLRISASRTKIEVAFFGL